MSNTVATLPGAGAQDVAELMERVLLVGDLSQLTAEERTTYYMRTCSSLGLNPYTRPLEYVRLSGKTVLYARKDCTDQLRRIHGVSLEVTNRTIHADILTVTVRARLPDGRSDEDIGAVAVRGLAGEALANACMKAITKAKRRATLSLCGLGLPDETEVESGDPVGQAGAPAIAPPPLAPAPGITKSKIKVRGATPNSGVVTFERSLEGIAEALEFIAKAGAPLVMTNHDLLDNIATMKRFEERVADIRAAAAEELAPAEEWPGQHAGAEPPEEDSTGRLMAVLRGERPADMSEAEASNLPE